MLLGVGLACIAIPIAVHLLMRRRRKPVRWAAMRFLFEAYRRQRTRVRLEQILLLAARCLLVACIAGAVSRPMFGRGRDGGGGPRDVYLLLDNGIASGLRDADGRTDLEHAVDHALTRLGKLESARGDRVALISLAGPASAVVLPPTSDLGLVERKLRELQPADSGTDLAGGLALASAERREEGAEGREIVEICSAFREGSVGRAAGLPPVGAWRQLTASPPTSEAAANIGIVSCELLRPLVLTGKGEGANSQLRVRLFRSGSNADAPEITTVRVFAEAASQSAPAGDSTVKWEPGQTEARATIDVDPSSLLLGQAGVIRAEIDRDANEFDNRAWAAVSVRDHLRVAIVGTRRFGPRPRINEFGPSDWLELAISPAEAPAGGQIAVETLEASRLNSSDLAGYDVVIVAEPERVRDEGWSAVGTFAGRGGTVVLFAAKTDGAQLWVQPAESALGLDWVVDREATVTAQSDRTLTAPEAGALDLFWYLRGELADLAATVSVERTLGVSGDGGIVLATGDARPVLLIRQGRGERGGVVAMFTVALDLAWTDLPARPLMVPLLQELIRGSAGRFGATGAIVAGARARGPIGAIELQGLAEGAPVLSAEAATGTTREPVRHAGAYQAIDATGGSLGVVTVLPDAPAAAAGVVPADRVAAWLGASTSGSFAWDEARPGDGGESRVRSTEAGPGLALLMGALALACVELALGRLFSHAASGRAPAAEGAA
ncbi:MAG: BatA domain-containing protein [Phycisphaerales bacterium]|nr:BatA domain-containing protein [Phycisphaerales bacterium]